MIKNITRVLLILLLAIFSFYYTNKSIELVREQDPIMKTIRSTSDKYNIKAVSAEIIENTIVPGITGKEINYEETYTKMKQYGAYNETLITLKDVEPSISITEHYDKYIISGNSRKRSVALIFKIEKNIPNSIINILNKNNTLATFFIDGAFLEENYNDIKAISNHELELLSYNNKYEEIYFKSSKEYLESLTNKKLKYCYGKYNQEEIINLCSTLKLHTIIPTIEIQNSLLKEIKDKLINSAIIYIPTSEKTKTELEVAIRYIKSRGYKIETLEELLSEDLEK